MQGACLVVAGESWEHVRPSPPVLSCGCRSQLSSLRAVRPVSQRRTERHLIKPVLPVEKGDPEKPPTSGPPVFWSLLPRQGFATSSQQGTQQRALTRRPPSVDAPRGSAEGPHLLPVAHISLAAQGEPLWPSSSIQLQQSHGPQGPPQGEGGTQSGCRVALATKQQAGRKGREAKRGRRRTAGAPGGG